MQKITKSACHQMPRNRDKMPHADAETQATYLDAKGAYAVRQTCAEMLKFTMYIIHSRHSRSHILCWLSLQSIHLPVCVLRCPAIFCTS